MGWMNKLSKAILSKAENVPAPRPPAATSPKARRAPKTYQVSIVGESHYRAAIRRCGIGDDVTLVPEPDNPHDPRAIAVLSERGEKIGYLPRESWLHRALLDEGKACDAIIGFMEKVGGGNIGVCLDVRMRAGEPLGQSAAS